MWQKVKNTEKTPSPFFSVDTQLVSFSSPYGHFFLLQHWKEGEGGILGLFLNFCHITSTIVDTILW